MDRDEEVGAVAIRTRRAFLEGHETILVPCERDAKTPLLEDGSGSLREIESDVFLESAAGPGCAGVSPAVAWIQNNAI
jgi:hypothetical protein